MLPSESPPVRGDPMLTIRAVAESDAAAWRRLWAGYVAFYAATVADEITEHTWRRMLDPAAPVIGRVAECGVAECGVAECGVAEGDGHVAGFSVSVIHEGTWTLAPVCYLEDLFVDPAARGGGIGRALIEDLVDLGRQRGWSRLYWHTRAGNTAARRLYDRFAAADDFVRYRMTLG